MRNEILVEQIDEVYTIVYEKYKSELFQKTWWETIIGKRNYGQNIDSMDWFIRMYCWMQVYSKDQRALGYTIDFHDTYIR